MKLKYNYHFCFIGLIFSVYRMRLSQYSMTYAHALAHMKNNGSYKYNNICSVFYIFGKANFNGRKAAFPERFPTKVSSHV